MRSSGLINLSHPCNRAHPLAAGLAAWYLTLPGWEGGRQWYDLMGLRHGTHTSYTSSAKWEGTTRPGGFGHWRTDSTGFTRCPLPVGTGPTSVAFWARRDTSSSSLFNAFNVGPAGGGMMAYWSTTYNGILVQASINGGNTSKPASAVTQTDWHHYLFTYNGGGSGNLPTIYVDGVLNSVTTGGVSLSPTPDGYLDFNRGNGGGFQGVMSIDDFLVWGREITASEAAAVYRSSRAGHPYLLNRVRPAPLRPASPGGSAFQPAWAVEINILIGGC